MSNENKKSKSLTLMWKSQCNKVCLTNPRNFLRKKSKTFKFSKGTKKYKKACNLKTKLTTCDLGKSLVILIVSHLKNNKTKYTLDTEIYFIMAANE